MSWAALRFTALVLTFFSLIACGGGRKNEAVGSNPSLTTGTSIVGTVVVPQLNASSTTGSGNTDTNTGAARNMHTGCMSVPTGYRPLAEATLNFLDAANNPVGPSWQIGECGAISRIPSESAVALKITATGYQELITQLTPFQGAHGAMSVVSMLPESASYEIGLLQRLDNEHLGFTVIDSKSRQPVLGIATAALSVKVNDNAPASVHASEGSAFEQASIVFVLDASGSMVQAAIANAEPSKYQTVATGVHAFLDQKKGADEVAMVIFSDTVNFIDQTSLNTLFSLKDKDGIPYTHTFPADGFITASKPMRFAADAYNKHSAYYSFSATPTALHKDSPPVTVASYPFGNTSAFYDAIDAALGSLAARVTKRKWIITLNDDQNDHGANTVEQIISKAKQQKTAVFTLGLRNDADTGQLNAQLKEIAERTGGTFYPATGNTIASALADIQIALRHQIVVRAVAPLDLAPAKLSLTVRGVTLEKTF